MSIFCIVQMISSVGEPFEQILGEYEWQEKQTGIELGKDLKDSELGWAKESTSLLVVSQKHTWNMRQCIQCMSESKTEWMQTFVDSTDVKDTTEYTCVS